MIRQRSPSHNKHPRGSRYDRLDYLRLVFVMLGGVIALRLFIVQVVQHGYYEALAVDNHELFEELFPERGSILVHDRYSQTGNVPIATNKVLYEVHAEPIHVTDAAVTAADLSPLLSIDKADIEAKLTKPNDPDEILKRRVPEEVMTAIKEKNLPGITFREEQWRYYSEGPALAHVTGYFGYSDVDRVGQYGLEGYFNKELAGQAGYVSGEKDALGRFLTIGNNLIQRAVDGDDIVLTIDKNIQYSACDKLGKAVERLEAKKGTLIIMQPSTGAIIAMCNYPTYDPNNYNEVESVDVFSNAAISDEYEPGSAFKTFTMAAGLDTGKVTPTTTYNDTSEVKVAGMPIKNSDGAAHGVQTMTAVLEKSYNLGTIFVTQQIGNAALNDYVKAFGFGDKTGITLANERSGDISSLETLKDVYAYTGSFGHGIMVTPLQLVAGYGAVANHGMLMKPYIVENRILASGAEIPTTPTEVRQVISADAARTLTAMLVSVIDSGTAKPAAVPGYYLAGKTGTALIVSNGVYSTYKHNDTMIGFGPMSDPQFVMLIEMNEPKSQYAEGSVVPVWGEIAKDVLNYMQIPPDRN